MRYLAARKLCFLDVKKVTFSQHWDRDWNWSEHNWWEVSNNGNSDDSSGSTIAFSLRETFGYTGKSLDNIVGQYDYGYRHYDPLPGRFTTLDPIQDGDNWYAYCGNDGINLRDPFGLCVGPNDSDANKVFQALKYACNFDFGADYSQLASKEFSNGNYLQAGIHILDSTCELAYDGLTALGGAKVVDSIVKAIPLLASSISSESEGKTQVLKGQFVNRVYDSRYSVIDNVSGPLGRSFSPGSGLPTTATEAIIERGLGIYNTNNAQMGVVYRALENIPIEARIALQGTAPEILIDPQYFKYLEKVFEVPIVK